MRKIVALILVVMMIMHLCIPVRAEERRAGYSNSELYFNGTTAICSLEVSAANSSAPIVASVTLKRGNTVVKQWLNMTASGYMNFSDSASVAYGNTYTLHVSLYVNGVQVSVPDITKTCN